MDDDQPSDPREDQSRYDSGKIDTVEQETDLPEDTLPPGALLPLTRDAALAKEWALVLRSQGLDSQIQRAPAGFFLIVPPQLSPRALAILQTWREENRQRSIPAEFASRRSENPVDYALAFAAVIALLAFHFHLERSGNALLYFRVGRASAYQIMHGEVWRVVTALTLHANLAHVLGNTLIGGLFLASLAGRVGAGFALAGAIFTGALGNLANAIQHLSAHSSIGASTAVFGVVGLLCGIEARRRKHLALPWSGPWVPLGAGIALVAMLGTGGARVDLAAHLFGLLSGIALGFAAAPRFSPHPPGYRLQLCVGVASLLLVTGSWMIALRWATRT